MVIDVITAQLHLSLKTVWTVLIIIFSLRYFVSLALYLYWQWWCFFVVLFVLGEFSDWILSRCDLRHQRQRYDSTSKKAVNGCVWGWRRSLESEELNRGWLSGRRDPRCRCSSHAGVSHTYYSPALYSIPTAAKCFVWSCGSGRPPGSGVPVPSRPGLLRSAPGLLPEPAVWDGFIMERGPEPPLWTPASATERLFCGLPS